MEIRTLVGLVCLFAGTASATPVVWNLTGTGSDGGTLGGSFVYDADTDTYSSIVVTTSGGSFPVATFGTIFTTGGGFPGATQAHLILKGTASGQSYVLALFYNQVLTNAGGTVPLEPGGAGGLEDTCTDPSCSSGGGPTRTFVGSLTSTGVLNPTPAPSSLLLVMAGISVVFIWRISRYRASTRTTPN
jgi:hypothetical protein